MAFIDAARGLKVVTELVINHTLDQHPCFERARNALDMAVAQQDRPPILDIMDQTPQILAGCQWAILGQGNGVRTPMQWNAARNGGFSESDNAALYFPVINHAPYGFQLVNVDTQERSPSAAAHSNPSPRKIGEYSPSSHATMTKPSLASTT